MSKSKILFIMTGSIACYKACQVISRLVQQGHEVQVVATAAALHFVGSATLEGLSGKPVVSDLYAPGAVMGHIHLMRWADLVLVAPATANYINKIAQGIGDDLAATLFLAHDFTKPFLLAPAMNTSMYEHPITSRNMRALQDMGVTLLDAASGTLACGESGQGKLLDPDLILDAVLKSLKIEANSNTAALGRKSNQVPFRVLVTAGGTSEALDRVRVLTNLSTGATGAELSEVLTELGCEVVLLRAASGVAPLSLLGIEQVCFTTFASLRAGLQRLLQDRDFDLVIHAAAVSDFSVESLEIGGARFSPKDFATAKLSSGERLSIHFKNNPKIVDEIKSFSRNPQTQVVAFKLTSNASEPQRQAAVEKLQAHAHADFVVHNDTSDIDKVQNVHPFVVYQGAERIPVPSVPALASELLQKVKRSNHDPRP